jgi:hypothetical protein
MTDLSITPPDLDTPLRVASRSPQHPRSITARQRDLIAVELRKTGMTFDKIAEKMTLADRSAAFKCYQRGMKNTLQESADEHRAIELARLDEIWGPMFEQARGGSRLAVDRCILIMDRRAKYLGLDAPVRIRQEIITDDMLEKAIADLEAQNAALREQDEARQLAQDIVEAELVEEEGSPAGEESQLSPGQEIVTGEVGNP